ncbi:TetR family transcriptional regulator [Micromonospora sp. LOL_021]|uniref:TetR family transcriptional regulator n=1 Tax=Micromonospora sp. LOL_021 TaxID=3345417 RepID=UPI003A8ADC0E
MGTAATAVDDLDDPEAGEIEVVAGVTVGAVRQVVEREEVYECAVDPGGVADAVTDAVVGQYADPDDHAQGTLLMITSSAALRACYIDAVTAIEGPLAQAITSRCPDVDGLTGQVLAASASAAAKVAVQQWLQSSTVPPSTPGFVVPSGSLPDLVRAALTPLRPAFAAAAAAAPSPSPSE